MDPPDSDRGEGAWLSHAMTGTVIALTVLLLIWKHGPNHWWRGRKIGGALLKPMSSLPTPREGNIVLGQTLSLLSPTHHRKLTLWAEELGHLYRVRIAHLKIVVLTDPRLAAPLISSGPDALPKASFAYQAGLDFGKYRLDGIFSLLDFHGEEYKVARKELTAPFNTRTMKGTVFPKASEVACRLAASWSAGQQPQQSSNQKPPPISVSDELAEASLDILLEAAYNLYLDPAEKKSFLDILNDSLDEFSLRVTNPLREPAQKLFPFLPWSQRIRTKFSALHDMWSKIYDHVMAGAPYSDDASEEDAFLASFWRLQAKGGFTREQVESHIPPMLIGGFETNAGTIAWSLYEIACHPHVQHKIKQEIEAAGLLHTSGPSSLVAGRKLTWEDLHSLTYFEQVLSECMRIRPIAASTSTLREADRDIEIDGYDIPKGTIVWMPIHGFHTSQRNWEDPHAFKPERFSPALTPPASSSLPSAAMPAAGNSGGGPGVMMPFLSGPRNCIGQNMAKVVVRVVLIELLSRLWFDVPECMGSREDVDGRERVGVTLKCEGGIHLYASPHMSS